MYQWNIQVHLNEREHDWIFLFQFKKWNSYFAQISHTVTYFKHLFKLFIILRSCPLANENQIFRYWIRKLHKIIITRIFKCQLFWKLLIRGLGSFYMKYWLHQCGVAWSWSASGEMLLHCRIGCLSLWPIYRSMTSVIDHSDTVKASTGTFGSVGDHHILHKNEIILTIKLLDEEKPNCPQICPSGRLHCRSTR